MKIEHFTFGQLWKFTSATNLMRVTAAYHSMLRRRWNLAVLREWHRERAWPVSDFTVYEAERCLSDPEILIWKAVIAAIRNPAHRRTLRKLADAHQVTATSGCLTTLREIPWSEFGSDQPRYRSRAMSLGFLIQRWLETQGLLSGVLYEGSTGITVKVECDEMGAAVLWRKSGMPVKALRFWCCDMGIDFYGLFPWVPREYTGRVNPLHKPVNTTDVESEIHALLE